MLGYAYKNMCGMYHVTSNKCLAEEKGGNNVAEVDIEYGLGYPIFGNWYAIKDQDGIFISDGVTGGTGRRSLANASPAAQKQIKTFFEELPF